MPTWGDILNELDRTTKPAGVPDFDAPSQGIANL